MQIIRMGVTSLSLGQTKSFPELFAFCSGTSSGERTFNETFWVKSRHICQKSPSCTLPPPYTFLKANIATETGPFEDICPSRMYGISSQPHISLTGSFAVKNSPRHMSLNLRKKFQDLIWIKGSSSNGFNHHGLIQLLDFRFKPQTGPTGRSEATQGGPFRRSL